jgi:hypothetical protein
MDKPAKPYDSQPCRFACLDRSDEDKSETFANPDAAFVDKIRYSESNAIEHASIEVMGAGVASG